MKNITSNRKMINYDYIKKENIEEHNRSWLWILNHTYRILIIARSASGAASVLFNLIKQQDDVSYKAIDIIYLYVKDPKKGKYRYLIENVKTAVLNDWKIRRLLLNIKIIKRMFIKWWKHWRVQPRKKTESDKIVFCDIVADMISDKINNQIITERFATARKLSIYTAFIAHCYFQVPKDIVLNCTNFFMKVLRK